MSLRFHEIAETHHHILNPFSAAKLDLLGSICGLRANIRILDLACGKGEMLARWAQAYGVMGVGVDISQVFIDAAKERAYQLDVGDKVRLVVDDAATYPQPHHEFDVVSCLGATWIGGGLRGTLDLMQTALTADGGLLLVGEPYWIETPPDAVYQMLGIQPDAFATLAGTYERFEAAGLDLVEMVLADHDDWDRYEAMQWMTVYTYLQDNPDDPDADALRQWITHNRRNYLTYGRRYLGWGVFVLHTPRSQDAAPRIMQPDRPVDVYIADGMLWARLADGRVIGNPLAWYPWLQGSKVNDVQDVELTGYSIEWPDLDQRIEIQAMLRGRP